VGRLREITLRQDVSASSPNLNIQKVCFTWHISSAFFIAEFDILCCCNVTLSFFSVHFVNLRNINFFQVFVVAQYERIYEFIFSTWLTGAKPVRRIVSDGK
jgi:hypothetical protein